MGRVLDKEATVLTLTNAHDAFWFLLEHPKLRCREAVLLLPGEASSKRSPRSRIRTVRDDMPWLKGTTYKIREFAVYREALQTNLDIFYTKVDRRGRVNDDKSQNKNIECWLEFGPIKQAVSDGKLHIVHYHDVNLDCGAPTFDEAIVKLARLVKKHYGELPKRKVTTPR